MLCDPTREPYSFMENGEIKGILPDYFKELAKYAGLSYQFIPCRTREEYLALQEDESFDIAIDARIDEGTAESAQCRKDPLCDLAGCHTGRQRRQGRCRICVLLHGAGICER